jgi:hypothetical protein
VEFQRTTFARSVGRWTVPRTERARSTRCDPSSHTSLPLTPASAASDPLAPLGHHWQDSTHISYGVLTVGVFTRQVKLEGSWFNGREPDERRYDFDLRAPDSVSGRLSVNPTDSLSFQASYGFLASPETLEPDESLHRITASATWTQRLGASGSWDAFDRRR